MPASWQKHEASGPQALTMTQHSDICIRLATSGDLHALCELEAATFSYDQIGRRSFRYLLRSSTAQVYVCVSSKDANLLAYAIVLTRKNSRYWRLYSLATSVQARGRGIGKAMLTAILNHAKNQANGIRLEVKCDNTVGIQLYRQLNFEVVAVLPAYYSDGSTGYRMQLSW